MKSSASPTIIAAAALTLLTAAPAQAAAFTPVQQGLLTFINGRHFGCNVDNNGLVSVFEFGSWVEPDQSISGEQSENLNLGSDTYYYENTMRGFAYGDGDGLGITLNSFAARRVDTLPSRFSWRAPVTIRLTLQGTPAGVQLGGSVTYEGQLTLPFEGCGAWQG